MMSRALAALFRPILRHLNAMEYRLMSALTDLQDAVTNLNTSVSAEIAAIIARLAQIPAGGTADADIAAVVAQLTTTKATLDAETAALATPPGP
jgi:hypothetical protein